MGCALLPVGRAGKAWRPGFNSCAAPLATTAGCIADWPLFEASANLEGARSVTTNEGPGDPDEEVAGKLARLAELEAAASMLRHDLRGMLAPALLVVDGLLAHSDPKVAKAGQTVLKAIRRVEERLIATRPPERGKPLG